MFKGGTEINRVHRAVAKVSASTKLKGINSGRSVYISRKCREVPQLTWAVTGSCSIGCPTIPRYANETYLDG
jgi:hypothetical protein